VPGGNSAEWINGRSGGRTVDPTDASVDISFLVVLEETYSRDEPDRHRIGTTTEKSSVRPPLMEVTS
jgi:hypothetical protein